MLKKLKNKLKKKKNSDEKFGIGSTNNPLIDIVV